MNVTERRTYAPTAVDEPQYACQTCHDEGYCIVATPGHILNGKPFPCPHCEKGRENAQRSYSRYLRNSGLPEHYQSMTFETFEALPKDQKAGKMLAYGASYLFADRDNHFFRLSEAYDFLRVKRPPMTSDPERNSLVLYGPYGVGKTGLAAAIVNRRLMKEATLYIRVQDLLHDVQKTYDRDYKGESRDAIVWRIKTAPLLVIDEFGLLNITNDRNEIMEEILRYRCGRDLPFVATTNDAPEVFRSKWDGRIVEVMLEAAYWMPMGEPVLRDQVQP